MPAIWSGALLTVYLAGTLLLLIIGRARVGAGGLAAHVMLLAVVAGATWLHTVPRTLRAWIPLLVLVALYSEIPMLIRAAGHTGYFDARVIDWERVVFHAQPAIAWARDLPNIVLSEVLHVAYLSYYPIIFVLPFLLHRAGRDAAFAEAVFVLMCTFVTCFVVYIAFPVAGPRYLRPPDASVPNGAVRQFTLWLLETRSARGTAFPSSHVAVSVTQSILAVRAFGRRGALVGVLTVGLALGAVYGGFHYAMDVVAGAVTGIGCSAIGIAAFRRALPVPSGEGDRPDIASAGRINAS